MVSFVKTEVFQSEKESGNLFLYDFWAKEISEGVRLVNNYNMFFKNRKSYNFYTLLGEECSRKTNLPPHDSQSITAFFPRRDQQTSDRDSLELLLAS